MPLALCGLKPDPGCGVCPIWGARRRGKWRGKWRHRQVAEGPAGGHPLRVPHEQDDGADEDGYCDPRQRADPQRSKDPPPRPGDDTCQFQNDQHDENAGCQTTDPAAPLAARRPRLSCHAARIFGPIAPLPEGGRTISFSSFRAPAATLAQCQAPLQNPGWTRCSAGCSHRLTATTRWRRRCRRTARPAQPGCA